MVVIGCDGCFLRVDDNDSLVFGVSLEESTKFPSSMPNEVTFFINRARRAFPNSRICTIPVSESLFKKPIRRVWNRNLTESEVQEIL